MEAPDEITPFHTTLGPNSKTSPRITWRQINILVMGLEKIDKLPKKERYDSSKSPSLSNNPTMNQQPFENSKSRKK
jgi:hypothetical protein